MTLDTDAVTSAVINYLKNDLKMSVLNKQIDVSVVVGRKSPDKPKPEVTATVVITDDVACVPPKYATVYAPDNATNTVEMPSAKGNTANKVEFVMPAQASTEEDTSSMFGNND